MFNCKKSSCSGKFYPEDKQELKSIIENFSEKTKKYSDYYSRAAIVPHAGYIYSGALAVNGYKYLNPNSKNIFIFAPAHYERIYGFTVSNYRKFDTPLGAVNVNNCINKELKGLFDIENADEVFKNEHSIEVQLPFIKTFFPNAKIIPILYGCLDYKIITEIIKHYWQDENNSFVISTDLSHFYPEKESRKIDNYTAQMIENKEIKNFDAEQACGAVGICGLVNFAKEYDYSLIRTGMTNSAEAAGNSSRVVGYGSWFLYCGSKNDYIKKYFSSLVIKICKDSILSGLNLGFSPVHDYPAVLDENGACFVTLELNGQLRGCIGSVIAHRPLIKDLTKNAHAAAFSDTRFPPLTIKEFENLDIKVSLLSKPSRLRFSTEKELLDLIVPFHDGLIIRDGEHQAVYLPAVWEQLPDKKNFLKSLKQKAGLKKTYFSETLEAYVFHTTVI